MALTLEEVFSQWQPPQNSPQGEIITQVRATLVLTQEDGHTSWGHDLFNIDPVAKTVKRGIGQINTDNDYFIAFFSDNNWTLKGQHQGLLITSTGSGTCHLHGVLVDWGNTPFELDMTLLPNPAEDGKIYQGRGVTIAHGGGRGVYNLTFNQMVKTTAVIS